MRLVFKFIYYVKNTIIIEVLLPLMFMNARRTEPGKKCSLEGSTV